MWGMSLTDTIICIVVALVVVGIFAVVCLVIAKRDNTKLEDLLASIPAEKQEQLKAEVYQPMDGLGIKCATRGLVGAVETNGDSTKVRLVFYNQARDAFYDQTTKIRTSEFNGKGYKLYDMIPCEMKYDKEYHIHEFKKIM
ncbi:MAG: hypothetical protein II477_11320 [Lachnospiraceae bacterium]|jgi:hypothetical protein|nr:hypothetical protein [Lachnospiraceae bacterium]MBQ3905315.1 hypothetical protein [Lachnospiraceae bacterium]MCR4597998.1 hypothetical protein [Acetatifactor sp.]